MFFKQIKYRGDNFSYIIADEKSGDAVVVDPSYNADIIINLAKRQGFKIKYVINTHQHQDHVAGNEAIKSSFGADIVAYALAKGRKDLEVQDGDMLRLTDIRITVIHTPGHTPDSICVLVDKKLLTGDTLFVGECGRTDLPGGSSSDLYDSLFHKLMPLDDAIEVYPGHDYGPKPSSTMGVEKRTNYTLQPRSRDAFIEFMKTP
jgi:hydroxyacylglutathione hydrolase